MPLGRWFYDDTRKLSCVASSQTEVTPLSHSSPLFAQELAEPVVERLAHKQHSETNHVPVPGYAVRTGKIGSNRMSTSIESEKAAQWFYLKEDQTVGPVATDELRSLFKEGGITASTYVFREGLGDWQKFSTVSELQTSPAIYSNVALPPTPQGSVDQAATSAPKQPSKAQFLWWPSSIIGSAALGGLLSYQILSVVLYVVTMIGIYQFNGNLPDLADLLTFGRSLFFFGLIYGGFIGLRYLFVLGPQKRLLRKQGLAEPGKTNWFDYLLDNSRAFIVTGLVVGALMTWQSVCSHLNRQQLKAQIDRNIQKAVSLQNDFERLGEGLESKSHTELERLKTELDQKSPQLLQQGQTLLANSAMSAGMARSWRIMMFWEGACALLALGLSFFVWTQKRREMKVLAS